MAKNKKYAKLRVDVSIEFTGKSDKTANKLRLKLEKLFAKKAVVNHIDIVPPDRATKMKTSKPANVAAQNQKTM